MSSKTLDKYKMEGVYSSNGVHGFFLLNIEATLYLLTTSIIIHGVISLIKTCKVKADAKEEDLSFVDKQIVKKHEAFLWESLPRQITVYSIQGLLFSCL